MKTTDTETCRSEYRSLRAATTRHSVKRFDEIARDIAHDLADGEDLEPWLFVQAAEMIFNGQDHA